MAKLWQIEANIDDMNPQNMEYIFAILLKAGVNDVWAMPLMMKKCRMAAMLCVLCTEEKREHVIDLILRETTTIGTRYFPVERTICDRRLDVVTVDGYDIHCKISSRNGVITTISVEYDDCRAAAMASGQPLKEWQRKALKEAYRIYGYDSPTDN